MTKQHRSSTGRWKGCKNKCLTTYLNCMVLSKSGRRVFERSARVRRVNKKNIQTASDRLCSRKRSRSFCSKPAEHSKPPDVHEEWDVCKSPGFPSNRVAAGQVDPPAVRTTMVCSLFACCLSASEAFLFLSGAVCWVFSNAYTIRKNICWFFRGW